MTDLSDDDIHNAMQKLAYAIASLAEYLRLQPGTAKGEKLKVAVIHAQTAVKLLEPMP